jgi:hypothetical protein
MAVSKTAALSSNLGPHFHTGPWPRGEALACQASRRRFESVRSRSSSRRISLPECSLAAQALVLGTSSREFKSHHSAHFTSERSSVGLRVLACHAGDAGSTPAVRSNFLQRAASLFGKASRLGRGLETGSSPAPPFISTARGSDVNGNMRVCQTRLEGSSPFSRFTQNFPDARVAQTARAQPLCG